MRTIALEEHYATPVFLKGPRHELEERTKSADGFAAGPIEDLLDVGANRIAKMNQAGIDVRVVSHTAPGAEHPEVHEAIALARDANGYVTDAVRRHLGHFAGFATLPSPDPRATAEEFERRIGAGFKRGMINGHVRGRHLDDRFFWPIFESAQALGTPLYLHPTRPPPALIDACYAGFSKDSRFLFANAGFEWHIGTAVDALRIILGGVFDQFPKLQLILGHFGETLLFTIKRVDNIKTFYERPEKADKRVSARNFSLLIQRFQFRSAVSCVPPELGIDRIMFSADYPYASMSVARSFLDQLPVSPADEERIVHGNAAPDPDHCTSWWHHNNDQDYRQLNNSFSVCCSR